MKAKTNLKAVEAKDEGQMYKYDSEQMSTIAELLYFARAALDVLHSIDTEQPDSFENGSISVIALEAKEKVEAALNILNP